MELVTLDKNGHRLSFGVKEWIAAIALFMGPTISFGTFAWKLSDRQSIIETKMAQQTEILQRLDSAREQTAVMFDRVGRLEERVSGLEREK